MDNPISLTDITLGPNSEHSGQILRIGATLLHLHLSVVLHGMGIGQHSPTSNNESAAAAAVLPLALPREREIRLRMHAEHLHHRVHRRDNPRDVLPLRHRHGRRLRPIELQPPFVAIAAAADRDSQGAVAVLLGEAGAPALGRPVLRLPPGPPPAAAGRGGVGVHRLLRRGRRGAVVQRSRRRGGAGGGVGAGMLVVGGFRGFIGRRLGRPAALPLVVDHDFPAMGGIRRRGTVTETATEMGFLRVYGRSNLGKSLAIDDGVDAGGSEMAREGRFKGKGRTSGNGLGLGLRGPKSWADSSGRVTCSLACIPSIQIRARVYSGRVCTARYSARLQYSRFGTVL